MGFAAAGTGAFGTRVLLGDGGNLARAVAWVDDGGHDVARVGDAGWADLGGCCDGRASRNHRAPGVDGEGSISPSCMGHSQQC